MDADKEMIVSCKDTVVSAQITESKSDRLKYTTLACTFLLALHPYNDVSNSDTVDSLRVCLAANDK
jgi:hypothetical protein